MSAGNKTKFYGSLSDLIRTIKELEFDVIEIQHCQGAQGGHKQICLANNSFVNWWESTGTLVVHGRPEVRNPVEKRLFTHVNNRNAVAKVFTQTNPWIYDAFISHASEDKDSVARPLAESLIQHEYTIWFDEYNLVVGNSLRRSIEEAISTSRFGIVVLSPNFFAKEWTQRELDALTSVELASGRTILPVWHEVDIGKVREFSPSLADKVAISTKVGIDEVATTIMEAIDDKR